MDMGGTPAGMMMHPNSTSSSSSSMGGHMKGMMHMTFFWGHNVDILFSGWPGNRQGPGMYLLALLLVFAASALVDFLSYLPTISRETGPGPTTTGKGIFLTGITAVRTGLSYLVMLAVMSFNVGVLIAAILGHALGFFVFGSGIFFRRGHANQSANGHQYVPPTKC